MDLHDFTGGGVYRTAMVITANLINKKLKILILTTDSNYFL
jgi:hypothetical protein